MLGTEDVSEEAIVATQDPVEEQQHLAEEEGDQDSNMNSINYATDQGKPRCISPIIIASLLHHYYVLYLYMCIRFCRN